MLLTLELTLIILMYCGTPLLILILFFIYLIAVYIDY